MSLLDRLPHPKARRRSAFVPAALLVLLIAGCSRQAGPVPDPAHALAQSISIIRSATPDHPKVLKILFYGQSISTRHWTDQAMVTLRSAYPNVRFDYRNLALGGWSAAELERATERDMAESYPDLVVFHVYGDHRAYRRIIEAMRTKTAADIVIQTDHVVTPVEPLCDAGLHLRWSPPPGCTGHFWFKQHGWEDYMSGRVLPELAGEYDLALEPRRQRWNAYLQAHHLQPMALIGQTPHPTPRGWTLMARLFTSWFEKVVATPNPPAPNPARVQGFAPPRPGIATTYEFDGNRIELLASGPLNGKVGVLIDGKRPETIDGCWQNSRVSRLPNAPDWPALRQVGVDPALHRPERWRVRVGNLDPGQARFSFAVWNSKGSQGSGTADATFTSRDGKLTIDPKDWMLANARNLDGKGVPEGTTVSWDRHFACVDDAAVPLGAGKVEQRYVLATGLANGHHVARVLLSADAPRVEEVRAYRPPL